MVGYDSKTWHSSESVRMCEFANKCKDEIKLVKIYLKRQPNTHDVQEIIAIEYTDP